MFILTGWLPNIDTLLYVFDMLQSDEEKDAVDDSTEYRSGSRRHLLSMVTGELNHYVLKAIGLYFFYNNIQLACVYILLI